MRYVSAQSSLFLSKVEPAAQDRQAQHDGPQEAVLPWAHQGNRFLAHGTGMQPPVVTGPALPWPRPFFPEALRAAQLPTLSLWPRCKTLGTLCGSEVPGGGMCVSVCVFTPSKTWVQGLSDSRTFSPSGYHRTQRIPQTQSPPGREPSLTPLHPPNTCSISTTRGPG